MLLDVPHAVMGKVAHQHLPPQVQDFIHHVPKSVEQIPLVLLWEREKVGRDERERVRRRGGVEEKLTRRKDRMRMPDREGNGDKKVKICSCIRRKCIKSTLRARQRSEERSETAEHRFVQISLSALLLFAMNVCSTICPFPSSELN